jgi:hypothetical protein
MKQRTLKLEDAEQLCDCAEMFRIFWGEWHSYTEIEDDALQYLVKHSFSIILPNVKSLSPKQKKIISEYKKGLLQIGDIMMNED